MSVLEDNELRDEVDRLVAEIETLRRERDEWKRAAEANMALAERNADTIDRLCDERDEEKRARLAAEAHNAALREALERIVPPSEVLDGILRHDLMTLHCRGGELLDIRAALALPPGDALRALVTRACETTKQNPSRLTHLVVDDVLGKAGE